MFESHNLNIVEVNEVSYKLPKEFVMTAVIVMGLVLQYIVTIYAVTMRARITAFRGHFMKQFAEEHKKAFPNKVRAPEYGYPDTGNGRYGKKLAYPDWFNMGNG